MPEQLRCFLPHRLHTCALCLDIFPFYLPGGLLILQESSLRSKSLVTLHLTFCFPMALRNLSNMYIRLSSLRQGRDISNCLPLLTQHADRCSIHICGTNAEGCIYWFLPCVRGCGEYRDESDPVLPFLVMAQCFLPRSSSKRVYSRYIRNLMELEARSGGRDG